MRDANDALIILIMLSLMVVGFVALFNLGKGITPALDTSIRRSGINIAWSILLRLIIAPAMIVIPAWISWNIIKE